MSAELLNLEMIGENSLINQELYRIFVTQGSEGIWLVKLDEPISIDLSADELIELFYRRAFIAECNQAMAKMYGYASVEEFTGTRLSDLLVLEDKQNVEHLQAFIKSNFRLEDAETHEVDRNGNPKFFLNNLIGIVEDGFLKRVWGTQRDITETLKSQEALKTSEERYRSIVNQTLTAVAEIDLNGRFIFANDNYCELIGYTREELLGGMTTGDVTHPEDLAESLKITQRLIAGEESFSVEKRYIHKNGAIVWVRNGVSSLRDAQGNIKSLVAFIIDITKNKESEAAKASLAAIVESSDDAIISKNLDSTITSWNKGAEKTFGYSAQEAIGKSIKILIPDGMMGEERDILERIKKGESVEHYETIRQRKDGEKINISLSVSPVRNDAGEIVGASKIARDITKEKRVQESLRESEERYKTLFESIDEGFCVFEMLFDENEKPLDYLFLEVNPAFEKATGLVNAVGKTARELVPDLESSWFEIYGKVALTGESIRFTQGSDAMSSWFDVYAVRVGGEKSRKVALIFNNVTERKQAEEKLRESEEKFAKAFNASPLVLTITSLKTGKLIEVNETFIKVSGYTREETIGRTTAELGLWADSNDREAELSAVQAAGEIRDFEYNFRVKDGRIISGLLSAELIELRGEPCALTVIQDITERKKAAEISERYRLLSMRARDVILFFRRDGQIVDANQVAIEAYGYAQEDLLRMRIHDLRSPETLDVLESQLTKANNGGVQFETVHIRRDGTTFPVEVSSVGAEVGGERLLISIVRDITERRKNEEIVRRSVKQLALVTDIAPVFIVHGDAEKRYKFVNKAYAERFGVDAEAYVGKPIVDIIGQEAFDAISGYIETVLSGQPVEFEEKISYQSIGDHFVHVSYAPEFDESGNVVGFVAAITDISERRRMEEAVRESENQLRQMADSMPQVVWIAAPDGTVTYYNNRVSEFSGIVKKDDNSWDWQPVLHPDDLEPTVEAWKTACETKGQYVMEHRIQMSDGNLRWHLSRAIPALDENGEVAKWYGTATDIHNLKETQDALLEAERRASDEYLKLLSRIVPIAQTLGTARDLVSIYRALHEFVRVSMPCTAFFVSSYNAENSLRIAEYVWGEDGEVDVSTLPPMTLTEDGGPNSQAIFQKKSVVLNDYWTFMKTRPHVVVQEDGRDPHSSLVVPMAVMNRIIGTLEVQSYEMNAFTNEHIIALEMVGNLAAVAIENIRLLQVEADARESAEAANRAKDEFLSVLSHELRTPLNSMLGWTRMLKAGVLDKEKTDKAIEVIERNTLLQNNLIEDLLDVSRIISGKMRIDKESVDLIKLFNDSVEILRPFAAQKNILFEVETVESSLMINGDATRLQQIITNLVQNAVKFTGEGGKIEVALKRNGNFVRIIVKDDGIGITQELLPFIFERFRQADSSTKRVYSGLGLGLTIVNNLVELHGGTISAESDGKGKGATFTVQIPLSEEFLEELSSNGKQSNYLEDDFALAGARILLVDDDFESLIPLQLFLEREKAQITTANSAKEALEKLSGENFHILITDIGMPFADGYDLISKVRQLQTEQNAFITAIALTAYASSDDRRRALASGFQEHLAKPVDYDELLETIRRIYEEIKDK